MLALEVKDIDVLYGKTRILRGLSFDANNGELIGIIGPNGAGKTTLIKTICGLVAPKSGQVCVNGNAISRGVDSRKFIGFVPQSIGLYPHLTAAENLRVFAGYCGLKRKEIPARVGEALVRVGMAHRAESIVGELSGGMKRRINFAAAILHDPAVLILDEPTAGVDTPARDAIHKTAKDLTETGMTVMLITHELDAAEHYCDRILILEDGQKRGFGAPESLLADAFKDQKECVVTLQHKPSTEVHDALRAQGFGLTEHPRQFHKMISEGHLAGIDAKLSAAKIDIRELVIREPGLGSLMYHLCHKPVEIAA